MKRDFSVQLKDLEGVGLTNEGKPFTLKAAAISALMTPFEDERGLSGEQKFTRYTLAVKVNAAAVCAELSAEETALLKQVIGKAFTPLVVGQCFTLLDADYDRPRSLGDNFT